VETKIKQLRDLAKSGKSVLELIEWVKLETGTDNTYSQFFRCATLFNQAFGFSLDQVHFLEASECFGHDRYSAEDVKEKLEPLLKKYVLDTTE